MHSAKALGSASLHPRFSHLSAIALALLLLPRAWLLADPTTAVDAKAVVQGWLRVSPKPLGCRLGGQVGKVETYRNAQGAAVYFIVHLQPSGFVVVSADDLVEPVIAFSPGNRYDPSPTNPLGALVSRDVPGRVKMAQAAAAQAAFTGLPIGLVGRHLFAKAKWQSLRAPRLARPAVSSPPKGTVGQAQGGTGEGAAIPDIPGVSDPRVDPLIQSKWDQGAVGAIPFVFVGFACYNYYTPPFGDGLPNNYPCGCTATAMAQLMHFNWEVRPSQYPVQPKHTGPYDITVDGNTQSRSLRGGDGQGASYDWGNMVLVPDFFTGDTQRKAIGALTYDAGVAAHMDYKSSASGAWLSDAKVALLTAFGYGNAVCGGDQATEIGAGLTAMLNPNLDASYPVLLGISGTIGGKLAEHAVVVDGYGYIIDAQYHHLNLGWSGSDDAWYLLPTVDTSQGTYSTVNACVYNVFVTKPDANSCEIISGRALGASNNPLSGVVVTGTRSGGGTYTATTNARGIYALARMPAASQYTITGAKAGYAFTPRVVSTGTSHDGETTSGNCWPVDLVAQPRSLTITAPNGGESYKAGSLVTITWTAGGTGWQSTDKVKVEYSADAGTTWNPIVGAGSLAYNLGTCNWNATGLAVGSQYRVKVSFLDDPSVKDASDANFTLTAAPQQFTISGKVTTSGGEGIPGVAMNGLPGNPVTQWDGSYTATVDNGWSGTVTPFQAGYTFTPTSNTYANVTGDLTGNYTAAGTARPSGIPWAWGFNRYGQLGDNSTTDRHEPVQVDNLTAVVALAGGDYYTLALKSDGTVWAWGDNRVGELGDNSTTQACKPVQVKNLTAVIAIAAGGLGGAHGEHSLAVRSDGRAWAWGSNNSGQLGDNMAENPALEPVQVHKLTGVVAVAAGQAHSLALKKDGTLWAWGSNGQGQRGFGGQNELALEPGKVQSLTGVVAIAASAYFSLALKSDGTVWGWGTNWNGELGDNCAEHNAFAPVQVHFLTGVIAIAACTYDSLALKNDGTVWAWGMSHGCEPVQIHNLAGVVGIAAGENHWLAVKADGSVWAWGGNGYGELGDNQAEQAAFEPVQVHKLGGAWAVAAGDLHSLGIAPLQFTISGSVKNAGGTAIPGVTMSGLPGNPVTQSSGSYTATVVYGWSGTVTPTKSGYTFSPASKAYTNVTCNQTANYTGANPTLSAPADITVEQTSRDGTTVSLGQATATGFSDPDPVNTNDAPAVFPLGTTTVTWTATDSSGNHATATQRVTVVDTTPPDLTVPADTVVVETEPDGIPSGNAALAPFFAAATVTDLCDAAPVVTHDAPPFLPVGTTTVTFTAQDASGNTTQKTAKVTVVRPKPHLTCLSPDSAAAGGPGLTVTLYGSGFDSKTMAYWNASPRPVTLVSWTEIQMDVSAADVLTKGSASVCVANWAPAGGVSESLVFIIGAAQLTPSTQLTRSGAEILATVTVTNSGNAAATNVQVTTGVLGTASAKNLPLSLGTIAAGGSAQGVVRFPGTAGASGATSTLRLTGTHTGGSFQSSARVRLP